jgi:hypothetical protein
LRSEFMRGSSCSQLRQASVHLHRDDVLAPTSSFINPPFGLFAEAEKPALLAYLRQL